MNTHAVGVILLSLGGGLVLAFLMVVVASGVPFRSKPRPLEPAPTPAAEDAATWRRRAQVALRVNVSERRRVVCALLPVLDNLELAQEAGDLPEGVRLVVLQFQSVLAALEIVPVEAEVGQDFDPRYHEAVSMMMRDAAADGACHVIEVMRRGYVDGADHGSLIRPALVTVWRGRGPS